MELLRPYYLALLAEVYSKAGQAEEALTLLAEAQAVVHRTRERWWEAELYRLKGALTLQSTVHSQQSAVNKDGLVSSVEKRTKAKGKSEKLQVSSPQPLTPSTQEAEGYFLKAIEIARKQQAKSLELRATMSLSRLWQQQSKKEEARQMLAEIYPWFTEGFDTKDLKEAKALLQELASP
jgi:predicted ATPase